MKKILLAVLLIPTFSFADTPTRIANNKVDFAYGQVGYHLAFTQAEYDNLVAEFPEKPRQTFTVQAWEINLSTTVRYLTDQYPAFRNHSDWEMCKTKAGLQKKIKAMRLEYDSMQDLPAADKADIRQRYDWLKSFYNTLP